MTRHPFGVLLTVDDPERALPGIHRWMGEVARNVRSPRVVSARVDGGRVLVEVAAECPATALELGARAARRGGAGDDVTAVHIRPVEDGEAA